MSFLRLSMHRVSFITYITLTAQGTTRLLLTRIPHFKEVILMAFECPHCGNRNNEIQSGMPIVCECNE